MNMEYELKQMYRNMINLKIGGSSIPEIGATKFGGTPDVPADFTWPAFKTAGFDDNEVKERPLSFLAQFNCEEIARFDKDGLLPHQGLLSFFYEMESQRWGFDPKDAGCARVFWFKDISSLTASKFPENLCEDYRFPALNILAKAEKSLPDWTDFSTRREVSNNDCDQFEEARVMLGVEEPELCSKLLGWPDTIQNNMTQECELISRGYYLGGIWKDIPTDEIIRAEQNSLKNWILLFQLDTVSDQNFELMFGDCGRLYFYIRREDLLSCRFDRVWLIQQCY